MADPRDKRDLLKPVRVRYAPSPTGLPHIGNYRTALFDWLIARHTGGQFILRIEDTDTARTIPGAMEAIMEGLRWLGLDWDEGPDIGGPHGPYQQSLRIPFYQTYIAELLQTGHAYACYCSRERLAEVTKQQEAHKEPPRYDRRCRFMSATERTEHERQREPFVIRMAMPLEGQTVFSDLLRGAISFENHDLGDPVLIKADGFPTYHFAAMVDDHLMEITHVLRGEEWIPSAPIHVLIFRAFGWPEPVFVHVPLILAPDRSKLSKRHGAMPLLEYRTLGYLPATLINFLALLGWSYDDKTELFSRDELIRAFSLERIGTSASVFDKSRLDWMNGHYIRQMSPLELARTALPYLEDSLPAAVARPLDLGYIEQVVKLEQERLKTLADLPHLTSFFFIEQPEYEVSLLKVKGVDQAGALKLLEITHATLREVQPWDLALISAHLESLVRGMGFVKTKPDGSEKLDVGPLYMLLRIAVSGRNVTPPTPETLAVLGKNRTLERIQVAITKLAANLG